MFPQYPQLPTNLFSPPNINVYPHIDTYNRPSHMYVQNTYTLIYTQIHMIFCALQLHFHIYAYSHSILHTNIKEHNTYIQI